MYKSSIYIKGEHDLSSFHGENRIFFFFSFGAELTILNFKLLTQLNNITYQDPRF